MLLSIQAATVSPPVYGTTQVNITILDVNDNAPSFQTRNIDIHVWEDELTTTIIYQVVARDNDSGNNGTVRYRLAVNSDNTFEINNENGTLKLTKSLDYETTSRFVVIINAYDLGTPDSLSSNMTLTVLVLNRNDNPPVFTKNVYLSYVMENQAIGNNVLNVTATDKDRDQVTYSLKKTDDNVFGVWPNSGMIYIMGVLDRETTSTYTLLVVAKDNGKPEQLTATATIQIVVTDVNDNAPVFFNDIYMFSIIEGNYAGALVGFVSASDDDLEKNAELQYSIESQSKFEIDGRTGKIFASEVLDREDKSEYSLRVTVTDMAPMFPDRQIAMCTVIVKIMDINDNTPEFVPNVANITGHVRENKVKGTQVVQVVARDTDADENGMVAYCFFVNGKE